MAHTIDSLVSGIPRLGSYAGVLDEIEEILSDPQSTLVEVGEVIEKDPALTVRLLKLANSSFFGFPTRLETVPDAINLIGIQQVQDLISASSVVAIFDGVSPDLVNMQSFWKHSLACGVTARLIALDLRLPKPEKYFVTGLLHDIGRLVLVSRAPEVMRQILTRCRSEAKLLRDVEMEALGFDHTQIGEGLLRSWSLPANLMNAVRYHHNPMASPGFQREASLVHVADYLVNAMQLGSSGERFVPQLQPRAWERLNYSVESLEPLLVAVDDQITAVEQAFMDA